MIKVIASDMDGTLLGDDHRIAPETLAAVRRACDAGIRFMVATGRNFPGAMEELKGTELTCDYVVSSGAEVRNPQQEVVKSTPISIELCEEVYNTAKKYPVSVAFFTDRYDYRIGTKKEIEDGIIQQIRLFNMDIDTSEEIVRKSPQYRRIAVASSFIYNQEVTAVEAQKGPVLKEYIEALGYTMDEVMVLGDSLNDYSMISMDFGATVAMENAVPEIKKAAKYITKSNNEFGVAYAIDQVLEHQEK